LLIPGFHKPLPPYKQVQTTAFLEAVVAAVVAAPAQAASNPWKGNYNADSNNSYAYGGIFKVCILCSIPLSYLLYIIVGQEKL
jgi:hypothetical protein